MVEESQRITELLSDPDGDREAQDELAGRLCAGNCRVRILEGAVVHRNPRPQILDGEELQLDCDQIVQPEFIFPASRSFDDSIVPARLRWLGDAGLYYEADVETAEFLV